MCDRNDFSPIAEIYDQLVAWAPYEKWVANIVLRLKKYGLPKNASVLDVGCGTGLSTFPLARRGFDVTGVDRSADMLREAREKRDKTKGDVNFVCEDLLSLDLDQRFDAVMCMHSGLDYITDLEKLQAAFDILREHTRDGGLLTFDKCLDEPSFYKETTSNSRDLEDGTAIFEYEWDRDEKMFKQTCVVWRKSDEGETERTEVVHTMLAVPVKELVAMVEKAGFTVVEPPVQFTISDPGMGIFRAV